MAVLALVCLSDEAEAAIYWGNGPPIGRANLDGTHENRGFIMPVPSGGGTSYACGGVAVNSSHIFWADPSRGAIGRANLDGSGPDHDFITGAQNPCGVAVNASHVYWTNFSGDSLGRAKLDGSDVDQAFLGPISNPCGVAVNETFIFWSSNDPSYIGRALIAGPTEVPKIYEGSSDYDLCGLAVNETHVFWGSFENSIGRAGIDGSSVDEAFVVGVERPCGLAVDGEYLYWMESTLDGGVGRATLEGGAVSRRIIGSLHYSCGVAVDSVVVGPAFVLPTPQPSPCSIDAVKFNKRKGFAFVRVIGPPHGSLTVRTRGLIGRVLSSPPPPMVHGSWRWWVKVRPRDSGYVARRIRARLKRRGRARVRLRIKCEESGKTAATAMRRFALRRVR
jgi:hypothetical protein